MDGPSHFVLPDGDQFDHDLGVFDHSETKPFRDYGRFLEETKKRLLRYGRRPRKVDAVSSIHSEVGDDEIDVSTTPVYAAAELAVYSTYLGVRISEEDTSINPRFGNFAEDLVIVPDGYEQTYHYAQQLRWSRDMAYIDVPKLRLAIDIRPGRMSHSATNDGKAGLLGSRLAWLPRDSPVRCIWEVFNLMQDINLGLVRDEKFAYLPTALGGYGKPIPFGKPENFDRFCRSYKQGAHKELARELVRRCNRRFREYTVEHRYNTDEVLSAVSRVQSSWHDWIKGKSLYAPTCWLEAPPEVAKYRVAKHGVDVSFDNILKRLHASGHLVSESDLAVAYEHNQLCSYLVGAETHQRFKEIREESRKEWLNLSTFSMRLYGLIEKIGIDQNLHHEMQPDEYREFWLNITSKKLNLRAFLRAENFYSREAMTSIYEHGPMMVDVPLYPQVTKLGRRYWFEQTRDRQDHLDTNEEYESLLNWVKDPNRPEQPPSRKLTEDDPFIIKEIMASSNDDAFCIVTDDIQLCRKACMETKRLVVRIPCKWYFMSTYFGEKENPWYEKLTGLYAFANWRTIIDQGSIESYEELGFRDGSPIVKPVTRPFVMNKPSINGRGLRVRSGTTEVVEELNFDWEPYRFPTGYIFSQSRLFERRKHPHARGMA
jgi:hypothetical protein